MDNMIGYTEPNRAAGKSKEPAEQNNIKPFTNIVKSDIIYYKI